MNKDDFYLVKFIVGTLQTQINDNMLFSLFNFIYSIGLTIFMVIKLY